MSSVKKNICIFHFGEFCFNKEGWCSAVRHEAELLLAPRSWFISSYCASSWGKLIPTITYLNVITTINSSCFLTSLFYSLSMSVVIQWDKKACLVTLKPGSVKIVVLETILYCGEKLTDSQIWHWRLLTQMLNYSLPKKSSNLLMIRHFSLSSKIIFTTLDYVFAMSLHVSAW